MAEVDWFPKIVPQHAHPCACLGGGEEGKSWLEWPGRELWGSRLAEDQHQREQLQRSECLCGVSWQRRKSLPALLWRPWGAEIFCKSLVNFWELRGLPRVAAFWGEWDSAPSSSCGTVHVPRETTLPDVPAELLVLQEETSKPSGLRHPGGPARAEGQNPFPQYACPLTILLPSDKFQGARGGACLEE